MKLSEFPEGTIIEIDGEQYEVTRDWKHLPPEESLKRTAMDDREDVKIISVPWAVTAELIFMLMEEYGPRDAEGNYITIDTILYDAFERHDLFKKTQAAKEKNETPS